MDSLDHLPNFKRLMAGQIAHWPKHERFLTHSITARSDRCLATCEQISDYIIKLSSHVEGGLEELYADYRFLCEDIVLPEEEFFRRNDRYRLSSFEDALREVYANAPFMSRYMNGLLLSDVFWSNHASALDAYRNDYLPLIPNGGKHLEVGPGHGLLLAFAVLAGNIGDVEAWDVSKASLAQAGRALDVLGVEGTVALREQNIFDAGDAPGGYSSIVISEVLEHLEDPLAALKILYDLTEPGGYLWVHVPANSPAPDHLYLINTPEEADELVTQAGYEIKLSTPFPMSGATLERARKQKLAISCTIIGQKL